VGKGNYSTRAVPLAGEWAQACYPDTQAPRYLRLVHLYLIPKLRCSKESVPQKSIHIHIHNPLGGLFVYLFVHCTRVSGYLGPSFFVLRPLCFVSFVHSCTLALLTLTPALLYSRTRALSHSRTLTLSHSQTLTLSNSQTPALSCPWDLHHGQNAMASDHDLLHS
jgi:hypothetical protein